jgi:hypothetical protein
MSSSRIPIAVAAVLLCALAIFLFLQRRTKTVEIICTAVDSDHIAVGLKDATVVELSFANGQFHEDRRIPQCSGAMINALYFTAKHELVCSGEKLNIVGENGATREISVDFSVSGGAFGSVAEFQGLLAVICAKETILLFDAQGKLVKQTGEHTALYGDLRTSPNGQYLVASGHTPHVWASALEPTELGHAYYTFGPIAYGPERLYIGNQDGCVYQWQTTDWRQLPRVCVQEGAISQLAVQSDGRHLAVAANAVYVANEAGQKTESRIDRNAHAGLSYIAGTKLLTASGSRIEVWDCASGQCVRQAEHDLVP